MSSIFSLGTGSVLKALMLFLSLITLSKSIINSFHNFGFSNERLKNNVSMFDVSRHFLPTDAPPPGLQTRESNGLIFFCIFGSLGQARILLLSSCACLR
jgi:hypothetical protein